jgi:hypothetical protein
MSENTSVGQINHFNKDEYMNTTRVRMRSLSIATIAAGGCLALFIGSSARAGCSDFNVVKPASTLGSASLFPGSSRAPASFIRVSAVQEETTLPEDTYAVTGLWKFTMTAKGNAGIKDGTQIDFGYQTWHDDGTELLNSGGRPPMTSSFCMGVWERVSYQHYVLNHVTLSWDPTGTVFVGPGNIKEEIAVDGTKNHFAGTFEIIQYSTDDKTVLADIKGVVAGDRITAR